MLDSTVAAVCHVQQYLKCCMSCWTAPWLLHVMLSDKGMSAGQLGGSLVAAAWAFVGPLLPHHSGPPLATLLVSAALYEIAGRLAANMQSTSQHSISPANGHEQGRLSAAKTQSESKLRASPEVGHKTDARVAAAPWQQQSQSFDVEQDASLGSTEQQAGAVQLRRASSAANDSQSKPSSFEGGPQGSLWQPQASMRQSQGSEDKSQGSMRQPQGSEKQSQGREKMSQGSKSSWSIQSVHQGLAQLLRGFTLIAKSGYLCHVCLHFVLHYIVSTFFYFEKTMVVATAGGSASQMVATFALMNSLSAGAVAILQLTATVRLHLFVTQPHHTCTLTHDT